MALIQELQLRTFTTDLGTFFVWHIEDENEGALVVELDEMVHYQNDIYLHRIGKNWGRRPFGGERGGVSVKEDGEEVKIWTKENSNLMKVEELKEWWKSMDRYESPLPKSYASNESNHSMCGTK